MTTFRAFLVLACAAVALRADEAPELLLWKDPAFRKQVVAQPEPLPAPGDEEPIVVMDDDQLDQSSPRGESSPSAPPVTRAGLVDDRRERPAG